VLKLSGAGNQASIGFDSVSFPVAFGLGEIAWRQHDTNEAIRNYKLYLACANTNTEEATNVMQRLRELKGHSP